MPVPPKYKESYQRMLSKQKHSMTARRAAETPEQTSVRREASRKLAALKRSILTTEELVAVRQSQKLYATKRRARKKVKTENVPIDLPNLDIVKQELHDDIVEPFLSSKDNPFPGDIASSADLSDISESSSTFYTCTNTAEQSFKTLKLSMYSSTCSTETNDAISVFGEFVATKIRGFTDQNLQVEAQNHITNMLFEMEMKHSPKDNMPVINSIESLKTKSSVTATLPSNIVLISSHSKNIVAFNAMVRTGVQ